MGELVKVTMFWVLADLMADRRPEILVNSTFWLLLFSKICTQYFECNCDFRVANHSILQIINFPNYMCILNYQRLCI